MPWNSSHVLASVGLAGALVVAGVTALPAAATPHSMATVAPNSGGASQPLDVVEDAIAAIESTDPLALLALIHPDERRLIKAIYDASERNGAAAGTGSIEDLLQSVNIDIEADSLSVAMLSDELAWVSASTVGASGSIDLEALATTAGVDPDEFIGDGEPVEQFEGSADLDDASTGVAVVSEDGTWYLSLLYSGAELLRRDEGLPTMFAAGRGRKPTATNPTDAVTDLLAAISAKDPRRLAATLSGLEGRLVADYESTLGGRVVSSLAGIDVAVGAHNLVVVEETDGRAIVEVDEWSVDVSGVDDYDGPYSVNLAVSGLCGTVTSSDDGGTDADAGCPFNDEYAPINAASVLVQAGWRGPRFVAIEQDGIWTVSLFETLVLMFEPFVDDPVNLLVGVYALDGGDDESVLIWGLAQLARQQAALGAGSHTLEPVGEGRYGLFRVDGPVTVIAEPANPGRYCSAVIISLDGSEITDSAECGSPLTTPSEGGVIFVTDSVLTTTVLGPIDVTISEEASMGTAGPKGVIDRDVVSHNEAIATGR